MFIALLGLVLLGAALHAWRSGDRSSRTVGEVVLVWMLVGYCGVPMLLLSVYGLAAPGSLAGWLGIPAGNPFQAFLLWAYLGMSVLSLLALRYRGRYLIGPAVVWAVFFAGATLVHLGESGRAGVLTHGGALAILATHGLISVILVAALAASGVWREHGSGGGAAPSRIGD